MIETREFLAWSGLPQHLEFEKLLDNDYTDLATVIVTLAEKVWNKLKLDTAHCNALSIMNNIEMGLL